MVDVLEAVQKSVDVFSSDGPVEVITSSDKLGVAYALPNIDGGAENAVLQYGPWTEHELTLSLERESWPLGTTLVNARIIVRWKCSSSGQYIFGVRVIPVIEAIDVTVDLKISASFDSPEIFDADYEAYQIGFEILVIYDPIGSDQTLRSHGYLRADGSSMTDITLL